MLAAGGLAAANEVLFAPVASDDAAGIGTHFNWRLVPATAVLAIALGAVEKLAPDFAVGLAGLVLLTVLIVPVGNAPTPIDNVAKIVNL